VPEVGHCAIAVFGHAFDDYSHAVGAITFVHDLFVYVAIFAVAGAALDGAFDVIFRHVLSASFFNSNAEPGVAVRVAAAFARSHNDFTG